MSANRDNRCRADFERNPRLYNFVKDALVFCIVFLPPVLFVAVCGFVAALAG